ncbi:MAG: hypothetical protein IT574_10580 [Candidatus Aureabacteria bacterium]|nr:hypothetical protein [Candidatus Auribacterota bacterium]HOE28203.1 hypothetical protein [bacterium]
MGRRARRTAISCACVLLLYFVCELVSVAGMRLADLRRGYRLEFGVPVLDEERMRELRALLASGDGARGMIVHDPDLGWRLRPGYSGGGQRTNAAGLVATREYDQRPAPGTARIAAFGDSFTQCVVPNEATWEQLLEESCRGIEVLNFGVSAYGPDQAYLRYAREGRKYHPGIVLIGYMTENLARLVNVFRPYADPMNAPLAKPRFTRAEGPLELVPNPLADRNALMELLSLNENPALRDRLGRHDNYYRRYYYRRPPRLVRYSPLARLAFSVFLVGDWKLRDLTMTNIHAADGRYNTGSEAYRLLEALLLQWTGEIARDGAVPVVLVFPQRSDIERWRGGEGMKQYEPLLEFLQGARIACIDLMDAFPPRETAEAFTADGHYSALGNRLVAARVGEALVRRGLVAGPCQGMGMP